MIITSPFGFNSPREKKVEKLLKLAAECCLFSHRQGGMPYYQLPKGRIVRVKSREFRAWLTEEHTRRYGEKPPYGIVSSALRFLYMGSPFC